MMCHASSFQADRRKKVLSLIRERFQPFLDDDVESERLIWWDQPRLNIYGSNAFFDGGGKDIKVANKILRRVRDRLDTEPGPRPFEANGLAAILKHHREKLEKDVEEFALDFLNKLLPFGMTADYQFHGYNDNMPAMWTWALTAGAEIFDNGRYREIANANMRQLRDMFRRRGGVSEYGSGYAPHRLTPLANIAELADDEETRELARDLEARIWAELAGYWSPAVCQFGGASMRGGPQFNPEMPGLMYHVFGDEALPAFMDWTSYYSENRKYIEELGLDPDEYVFAYSYCYGAEFVSATYHVPDEVAEFFISKQPASWVKCQTENGFVDGGVFCKLIPVYGKGGVQTTSKLTDEEIVIPHYPKHGAQPHFLTTYHGANYAVGTSNTNMFGTSHAFRCDYRRSTSPADENDIGTVLVRYNINGKRPCKRHENTYWKSPEYSEKKRNYCSLYMNMGRHHCLQHENDVMCLLTPEPFEYWQVKSMGTDIFITNVDNRIGTLRIDGMPVTAPAEFAETGLITIDEGTVYLAIHPLIGRHDDRQHAMTIRQTEEYLMISLHNLEGDEREMTEREMRKLGNGFVFQIRDADEFDSFDEFQEWAEAHKILDTLYGGVRQVHVARKDLRLSTNLCPYAYTSSFSTVNGLPITIPPLSFSNEMEKRLPFMGGDEAVGFEDWDWIEAQLNRPAETYNPVE